ncbi:MAG: hypothetical protein HY965_06885, partial [Ignavibacteriales bacterium]|nr:hypothetical protein [Ignavibacteriales bacterium]
IVDSFAIIIEAKSGTVSEPAKRGAPNRLFETLQKLIEEPSDQALRLIEFFKSNIGVHSFPTKQGTVNIINNSQVKYYIPLGITFSHLGLIGSNIKKLIKAGIVKKTIDQLIPSMSFADLEIVFELLPLEAEKIHYFARRIEFEAHFEYDGDELDLLAFYLDNGFNIGESEYLKEEVLIFGCKSKELDPYIIGNSEGRFIKKPELLMTKWWKDLLNKIAERKTDGWLETSFILLNSTKEDQEQFEKNCAKLNSRVKSGKVTQPHNWLMFISGPQRRKYGIAYYPYITTDMNLRNDIMAQIIEDECTIGTRGIAVIGSNLNRNDYPYTVLARRMSTDLFDSLSL